MNSETVSIILHVMSQGLIYSLVVLAVFITSRVIKFDDLTTEGSFGLGGAISAISASLGLAIPLSLLGGFVAGAITGLLHTRLKINNLICGLVVTTGLFSICLKMAGANLVLAHQEAFFVGATVIVVIYLAVQMLLQSEFGLLVKALGCNPQMLTSLAKNVDGYKVCAIAFANALTALAGALLVQWNGYYSITANIGTLIIGLAGLIIAEALCKKALFGLILGAIIYQGIFALTIECELEPVWNNLIKAVLIVLLIQMRSKEVSHVTLR